MPTVAPNLESANIGNYYIGRGICYTKLEGEAEYLDAGNVTLFEFQVKPTILPHYSSRIGVRVKDFTAVTELEATLTISMEEFTARNLGMALLGTSRESPAGPSNIVIDMFSTPIIRGAFKFVGTNVVGPQWTFEFPLVQLTPNKVVSLISQGAGSWGTIDLQGDVLKDPTTGQFCVATCVDFVASGG